MKITPQVFFHAEDIEYSPEKTDRIKEILIDYIESEGNQCNVINYVFCTDEYLLNLNKQYLAHDYYTDILSFQMDDEPIQGDIFISIDRVEDNAKLLNTLFVDELYRVISHGVLHFLGYNDKTVQEKELMRKKEDELIELLKKNVDDENK